MILDRFVAEAGPHPQYIAVDYEDRAAPGFQIPSA
jgi:hypothetical protein